MWRLGQGGPKLVPSLSCTKPQKKKNTPSAGNSQVSISQVLEGVLFSTPARDLPNTRLLCRETLAEIRWRGKEGYEVL